jgi:serine/threonine protein kinase
LLPVASLLEKDWSGRGQHTEFQKHEKKLVDSILDAQEVLGSTRTAIVQSVRCKRILLARKTVRCNRNFSKEKAIEEAAHLNKLDHSHVVQVIGTYIMGNELSILMYPVAEYNLESFTNDLDPRSHTEAEWINRLLSLRSFIGCLVVAVEYLHSHMTKHMDIKPQNILVRNVSRSTVPCVGAFKIYIADFGISRSYENLDAIETEGPTMFTPKYAAPEVVDKQKRGLSADIFSLGCVIVEIVTTLDYYFRDTKIVSPETRYTATIRKSTDGQHPLHDLYEILKSHEYGDTSYQANVDAVCDFLGEKSMSDLPKMLSRNPQDRPSATSLASDFKHRRKCCMSAADPLEAAARDTTEQETNEPFTP